MDLCDLLREDAILPSLKANSKKQVLQDLCERAAVVTGLDERAILDTVQTRERLGSTGVGRGIAIPHGKISGLDKITGVFGRLHRAVNFEALDDEPVDLVFLLVAPEETGAEHLKALSKVARLLRDPQMVESLRASEDSSAIYTLLKNGSQA